MKLPVIPPELRPYILPGLVGVLLLFVLCQPGAIPIVSLVLAAAAWAYAAGFRITRKETHETDHAEK